MINEAIKKQLRKAKQPLTCNDIFDNVDVRQMDDVDADDVSNALAALWRRGLLERFAVKKGFGRGPRYSYSLRKNTTLDPQHVTATKPMNVEQLEVKQEDDGTVVLRTDRLLITVRTFK